MKKIIWLASTIFTLAIFTVITIQFFGPEGMAKAAPSTQESVSVKKRKVKPVVTIETISTSTVTKILDLTGSVVATRTAKIASPGQGPVNPCATKACMVREGDLVKKGQVLLEIGRNKTATAQLLASRQALKEQKAELKRVETLVKEGAVPESQQDTARSKYENAKAQLAKSLESSADYSVIAPWDGVVAKVYVAEGDYIAPRATLIEILDPESLVIQFTVPESQSTQVRMDMPIHITLDAHPGLTLQGKVSRVYPQLDTHMHTRTVEAKLIDQVDLLPGMFARIQLVLAQLTDVVTVPVEAVLVSPEGLSSVFVLNGKKAVLNRVQIGIDDGDKIQIIDGIKPGDKLIVAGNNKLKNNVEVQVLGGNLL